MDATEAEAMMREYDLEAKVFAAELGYRNQLVGAGEFVGLEAMVTSPDVSLGSANRRAGK